MKNTNVIALSVAVIAGFFALALPNVKASEISGSINTSLSTEIGGTVVVPPSANPVAGTYTGTQNVTLSAAGASSIRFTANGSDPDCYETQSFETPIVVASSLTIKAKSCYQGGGESSVISFAYVINPAETSGGGGGGGGGGLAYLYEVLINNGNTVTNTVNVNLTLTGTGAAQMMISNSPTFEGGTWETFATSKPWVLTAGDGEKVVYAKYRDAGNSPLPQAQDTIILKTSLSNSGSGNGEVLGAATSCGYYLDPKIYAGLHRKNDIEQVKKIQQFLRDYLKIDLPVTGFFGTKTFEAVKQFQLKEASAILRPWVAYGLKDEKTATGFAFKLTLWRINQIVCDQLKEAQPKIP